MFKILKGKGSPYFNLLKICNGDMKALFSSSFREENKKVNLNNNVIIEDKKKEEKVREQILHLSNDAINKMKEVNSKYKNSKALKVCVEAGGCSGFQYSFSLIDKNEIKERDVIVYNKECVVIIDKHAVDILRNSKIHYTNNLISKKFTIENIQNISSKCSCGNSFDIDFY
ncbi:iron-sulfur assembly protein [Plasmodium brasilianum]|uniref:Iron-sulfur assembly protein, putative n=3 Tax=Plasmodium (Plasmodium) TaxID=418103 RepID=A0A1A8X6E3_PLAMA|nr:iron-sulfur assembly protein, putative [Plasmodium malariae]KAI4840463.1 iron-sulfur assembly protein [Plasmodium brasilianum]SBT00834.1 iron-sulfur assembly protein, putative (IscA1) [Plasmodium malariae]SBT86559.1 iron-sulfur assembly protein, putative [Plasmodium malariae]